MAYRTKKNYKLYQTYHWIIMALCVAILAAGGIFAIHQNWKYEHKLAYKVYDVIDKMIFAYTMLLVFYVVRRYFIRSKNNEYVHAHITATLAIQTPQGIDLGDERVSFEFYHNMENKDIANEIVAVYIHHMASEGTNDKISSDNLCEFINYNTHYIASTTEETVKVAMRAQFIKNSFFR